MGHSTKFEEWTHDAPPHPEWSDSSNQTPSKFWKDRWLHGQSISDLAPNFIKPISRRAINQRTVGKALVEESGCSPTQRFTQANQPTRHSFWAQWNLLLGRELELMGTFMLKFFLWLEQSRSNWTNLPHPAACPLCEQAKETIQLILVPRVVSIQIWFTILHQVCLQPVPPQSDISSFSSWWYRGSETGWQATQ